MKKKLNKKTMKNTKGGAAYIKFDGVKANRTSTETKIIDVGDLPNGIKKQ